MNKLEANISLLIITFFAAVQYVFLAWVPESVSRFAFLCVTNLAGFLVENLPTLADAALQLVSGLVDGLIEALPELIPAGVTAIAELAIGLIEGIPQLIAQIPAIIAAIWDGLTAVDWPALGGELLSAIVSGLSSIGDTLSALFGLAIPAIQGLSWTDISGTIEGAVGGVGAFLQNVFGAVIPGISGLSWGGISEAITGAIGGVGSFVALLAPYSSYGRIASNLLQPLYRWGNNLLASIAEHYESYAFYDTDVWMKSLPTFVIAVLTLVIVGYLAYRNGRTYCNTICPVGTVLGFVSRFSFFHITFDTDKCKNCSMCSRNCKASAIDFKNHTVDYSRCVACGNCLEKCKFDALHYKFATPSLKTAFAETRCKDAKMQECKEAVKSAGTPKAGQPADPTLRAIFGALTLGAAAAAKAQIIPPATDVKVDGGLADIVDKAAPKRMTKLTPPGSISHRNMKNHCTACQLCVSACPNGVLRPSTDLMTLMQPEMSFERGYCRPECIECSSVCPAGAIKPITLEEKSSIQIGHAVLLHGFPAGQAVGQEQDIVLRPKARQQCHTKADLLPDLAQRGLLRRLTGLAVALGKAVNALQGAHQYIAQFASYAGKHHRAAGSFNVHPFSPPSGAAAKTGRSAGWPPCFPQSRMPGKRGTCPPSGTNGRPPRCAAWPAPAFRNR